MSASSSSTEIVDTSAGLRRYTIGFVLALVLTVIPFALVAFGGLAPGATLSIVALCAVIQIGVHLVFFLHLDMSAENRWNTASALFTALILLILVGGTIWLFYSLNIRMV